MRKQGGWCEWCLWPGNVQNSCGTVDAPWFNKWLLLTGNEWVGCYGLTGKEHIAWNLPSGIMKAGWNRTWGHGDMGMNMMNCKREGLKHIWESQWFHCPSGHAPMARFTNSVRIWSRHVDRTCFCSFEWHSWCWWWKDTWSLRFCQYGLAG